jgi:hypothetical protein
MRGVRISGKERENIGFQLYDASGIFLIGVKVNRLDSLLAVGGWDVP